MYKYQVVFFYLSQLFLPTLHSLKCNMVQLSHNSSVKNSCDNVCVGSTINIREYRLPNDLIVLKIINEFFLHST